MHHILIGLFFWPFTEQSLIILNSDSGSLDSFPSSRSHSVTLSTSNTTNSHLSPPRSMDLPDLNNSTNLKVIQYVWQALEACVGNDTLNNPVNYSNNVMALETKRMDLLVKSSGRKTMDSHQHPHHRWKTRSLDSDLQICKQLNTISTRNNQQENPFQSQWPPLPSVVIPVQWSKS